MPPRSHMSEGGGPWLGGGMLGLNCGLKDWLGAGGSRQERHKEWRHSLRTPAGFRDRKKEAMKTLTASDVGMVKICSSAWFPSTIGGRQYGAYCLLSSPFLKSENVAPPLTKLHAPCLSEEGRCVCHFIHLTITDLMGALDFHQFSLTRCSKGVDFIFHVGGDQQRWREE